MTTFAQLLLNIVNAKIALDILAIMVGSYMLPTVIAAGRRHADLVPIAIVNAALGWTVLGFIGTLAWAFMAQEKAPT